MWSCVSGCPRGLFCGSLPLLLFFLLYLPAPPLETGAYAHSASAHTHTHFHTQIHCKFSLCQILHHRSAIHLGGVFGENMSSVSRLWPFLFDANLLCHCAGLIRSPFPSQLLFCRNCFPLFSFHSPPPLFPPFVRSSFCRPFSFFHPPLLHVFRCIPFLSVRKF